ncbi:MAG: low molecular weight protein-tyrosine-phosphatase [Nocardioides sp.]
MSSPATTGRAPGMRIAVVCLGNICRSPVAEIVLRKRLADAGLAGTISVESFGTGAWHLGESISPHSGSALRAAGYDDGASHRARQIDRALLASFDLVLAMDRSNLADLRRLAGSGEGAEVRLFRDFDPDGRGADVPDPYGGTPQDYQRVLLIAERTATRIVGRLGSGSVGGEQP